MPLPRSFEAELGIKMGAQNPNNQQFPRRHGPPPREEPDNVEYSGCRVQIERQLVRIAFVVDAVFDPGPGEGSKFVVMLVLGKQGPRNASRGQEICDPELSLHLCEWRNGTERRAYETYESDGWVVSLPDLTDISTVRGRIWDVVGVVGLVEKWEALLVSRTHDYHVWSDSLSSHTVILGTSVVDELDGSIAVEAQGERREIHASAVGVGDWCLHKERTQGVQPQRRSGDFGSVWLAYIRAHLHGFVEEDYNVDVSNFKAGEGTDRRTP